MTMIEERRTPIRKLTSDQARREIGQRVARFERIYEQSSEEMLAAVRDGRARETAEIAQWLAWYHLLRRLAS